jgi:hypothetical protein
VRSSACPPPLSTACATHDVGAWRLKFLNESDPSPQSLRGEPNIFSIRQAVPAQAICCNRPRSAAATIPATLLHPVFTQFLSDCEAYETTPQDNAFALQLSDVMSEFYLDEKTRADAIRKLFSEFDLHLTVTQMPLGYMTDGDMIVNRYWYAIAEIKNEVGSTGAEPYNQGILHYLESTREYAIKMDASCLPCIIILLFGKYADLSFGTSSDFCFQSGPYISFVGAAWNLGPVIQTLSATLQMHHHPTDTKMRSMVARHLRAFNNATRTLEAYYRGLSSGAHHASSPQQSQLFPYPTTFTAPWDNCQRRFNFEYLSQPFENELIFFGSLSDHQPVCVKFVAHYSTEIHRHTESLGCAPKLYGFETMPGSWYMVVMERLPEEYQTLFVSPPTASLINDIRNVLTQLHQVGFVHGDIRDANIMSDGKLFKIFDFDWGGKIGEARYPMNVFKSESLWRPDGAVDGALIKAEHDIEMLNEVARRYWIAD